MRKIAPFLIVLVVGGLAIMMFLAPWKIWQLDYTVLGNKGLEVWLQKHDIAVRRSQKHDAMREELSLRIMSFPYFRSSFGTIKDVPRMDEMRFVEKVFEMPSLVILPKWNAKSLEYYGVANRSSLLSLWQLNENMSKVIEDLRLDRSYLDDFTIEQVTFGMSSTPTRRYELRLYQMQFFDPESIPDFCRSVLSTSQGVLLLFCDANEKIYFLSDPDLLNNHGLALGEHAALAIDMISALRGLEDRRPIYLDNNVDLFKSDEREEEEGRDYERDSDDLIRMFDYPLSVIWGMMCLVVIVSLWRGFYRFGSLKKDMEVPVEISKTAAVAATARLLRLSRNDRRMVAQFVHGLLLKTAAQRFGRDSAHEAGIERLLKNFERRDRQKAAAARALIANLTNEQSPVGAGELRHKLHLLQQFIKEF